MILKSVPKYSGGFAQEFSSVLSFMVILTHEQCTNFNNFGNIIVLNE
jgi:hypothetical protein